MCKIYKCKWFTLTWDLHIIYTVINTYVHNIGLHLLACHLLLEVIFSQRILEFGLGHLDLILKLVTYNVWNQLVLCSYEKWLHTLLVIKPSIYPLNEWKGENIKNQRCKEPKEITKQKTSRGEESCQFSWTSLRVAKNWCWFFEFLWIVELYHGNTTILEYQFNISTK